MNKLECEQIKEALLYQECLSNKMKEEVHPGDLIVFEDVCREEYGMLIPGSVLKVGKVYGDGLWASAKSRFCWTGFQSFDYWNGRVRHLTEVETLIYYTMLILPEKIREEIVVAAADGKDAVRKVIKKHHMSRRFPVSVDVLMKKYYSFLLVNCFWGEACEGNPRRLEVLERCI